MVRCILEIGEVRHRTIAIRVISMASGTKARAASGIGSRIWSSIPWIGSTVEVALLYLAIAVATILVRTGPRSHRPRVVVPAVLQDSLMRKALPAMSNPSSTMLVLQDLFIRVRDQLH